MCELWVVCARCVCFRVCVFRVRVVCVFEVSVWCVYAVSVCDLCECV